MTFEVLRADTGKFHWRLRGADGRLVKIEPGIIKLPPSSATKRKRIAAATQQALKLAAKKAGVQA